MNLLLYIKECDSLHQVRMFGVPSLGVFVA